jgi:membrane-associated phospholipid phosphatase
MSVPYRIPPTTSDIQIANIVAEYTSPRTERVAEWLTWGADEHVLLAIAAGWWLYCRGRPLRARRDSDHILLTTLVVSVVPHLLKSIFDQRRPDRLTVRGHLHGVPFSGKPLDALPSGHAMHVGALVSTATVLPRAKRNLVLAFGAGLVLTRIVLLAHWVSDVAAGLALGALAERLLRPLTGYDVRGRTEKPSAVDGRGSVIGRFT